MNTKPTLVIIAAGNAKRMGNISVPKALYPILGEPNLVHTLKVCHHHFDEVAIVIKVGMKNEFEKVLSNKPFSDKISYIEINSGLGDGHAIMSSLEKLRSDDVVFMWGDAYLPNCDLMDEVIHMGPSAPLSGGIKFPVVMEENPYVSIILEECGNQIFAMSADFAKLGENHPRGYHDQSIFRANVGFLKIFLNTMHDVLWKNGRYISESGELNFLHILHFIHNQEKPAEVFITNNSVMGFNTIEEVEYIEYLMNPDSSLL